MDILGFPADRQGCGYYRIQLPLWNLKGHNVRLFTNVMGVPDADVYFFHRVTNPVVLDFIKYLRGKGKKVIVDIDDYFRIVPFENPARKELDNEKISVIYKCLNQASIATVSTKNLALDLKENKQKQVLPNFVDISLFNPKNNKVEKEITIGITGGASHLYDWRILKGILEAIEDEFNNVSFVFIGFMPNYFKLKRVKFIRWIDDIKMYYEEISKFDIGLAPLLDNKFNSMKSYIKALEYNAAGVVALTSDVPAYNEYIKHGKNGFLCQKSKHWFKYLRALIKNPSDLRKIKRLAISHAKPFDIRKNIHLWEKLLQKKEDF